MPLINAWAAIADPDIPRDVIERLVARQAAVREGRTPGPVPDDDKPYLARHVWPEATVDQSGEGSL